MSGLVVGGFLLLVGLIGFLVFRRSETKARTQGETADRYLATFAGWAKRITLVAAVLGGLLLVTSFLVMIPAGHVGVPVLFGKVQMIPLKEGLNIINPLYNVVKMDCRYQKYEDKYDAASRDLQQVHVLMILNFRVLPDKAPEIYQRVGVNYKEIIVHPAAQEVLKANTALHNVAEILIKRPELKNDVHKNLATWLMRYSIELKETSLANIGFDPDYEKAIRAKQVEEQNAEKKKYMLLQAQKDAEISIAKAKGEGDAAREKARGDADAIRIKGDAESYYNKKVSVSLTQNVLQQKYYEKWNGELPYLYFGGGPGATPLIQLPAPPPRKQKPEQEKE